jgi:hypothetical protein
MSSSTKVLWTEDGRLVWRHHGVGAPITVANLQSSMHKTTPTFVFRVMSVFGNPVRKFDTGLHDYNDAKRYVETLLRLEGKL